MLNPHCQQSMCTSTLITNTNPLLKHFYRNKTPTKLRGSCDLFIAHIIIEIIVTHFAS
jgi:hypothetical protein